MELANFNPRWADTAKRFVRFALVGASGLVVDMAILFLLADPRTLALNVTLAKALAAEAAVINNFIWNDRWTFRDLAAGQNHPRARLARFTRFNLICLAGIGLNILLLNAAIHYLRLNIYVANLGAIVVVSLWNFWMNLRFGWRRVPA